jgi:TolB-like protein/DNA-binding winged helix-turn-helix (wHTH) protein/tetratricopeptide (TPR) repeat protein
MGDSVPSPRVYQFGVFTLDARTGELTHNGSKTPLREQPLKLLLALLEQPGELVTREDLVSRLWPSRTFVDVDRGLNKAVNHLREVLGDSAEQPIFVETLPRKGYRFVAPVTHDTREAEPAIAAPDEKRPRPRFRWLLAFSGLALSCLVLAAVTNVGGMRSWLTRRFYPQPHIASLAVLPLENLSHDPQQEYFADGMTDQLITSLAKMSGVRVISRTSVMRYKGTKKSVGDVGRELDVDAIVEGTVMRSGNRARITAQLIQVSTDMHLWAESYERDVSEILDLQGKVASDIAREVDVMVRPLEKAQVVNPQAYGLYLKGRYHFYQYTSRGWQQSIDYFRQAIDADPKFALAYSGLADSYIVAGAYGVFPSREALNQGKSAANKALQIDQNLASAHYALGTAYAWYDWDWRNAELEFQRALALDPNDSIGRNWYGGYLSLMGKHSQAVDEHERARQLDPYSLIVNTNLARALYWAGRYDEAIGQAKKTLQIDAKFSIALFWLEGSLRHKGMFKEAVALRQAVTPDKAQDIERTFKSRGFPPLLRGSGETFKKAGALVEAARCYAQIGEKQEALALLEDCYEHRCTSMATLKAEPDFDVLQQEPRFQELLRKMGLL